MTLLLRVAAKSLCWWVLVFALLLPGVFGSAASIAAVLGLILLLPAALMPGAWTTLRQEPAMLLLVAAFAVLLASFAANAQVPGDVLYASNFLALPLAPALYLLARRTGGGREAVFTIATLCLLGTAACATVAAYDVVVRHLPRAVGLAMGGNVLGRVALLLGFLSLAGLLVSGSRFRLLFALGPILAAATVFLTGSRGALAGAAPMLLAALLLIIANRRHRWGLLLAGGLSLLVAAVLDVLVDGQLVQRLLILPMQLLEVLRTGFTADNAVYERVLIYSAGWQAFTAQPLLGHGWANFAEAAARYIDMARFGGASDPWFQFHNDALNFGVAAGIPGILALVAILVAPVAGVLAMPRDSLFTARLYAALVLSLGTLVFGLTDITLGYDLPTTLYAVLTAVVLGGWRERQAPAR